MMSVLLTGITGFIGRELGRKLVEKGYTVYGLIRHCSARTLDPIRDYLDRIHLIQGDLREYHSIKLAVRKADPEVILHVGAMTPVRLSFDDPFTFMDVNLRGTANLVDAAIAKVPRLRRFVLASTMEVYGWADRQEPFKENLSLVPASPYAVSKAAADMYVRMMGRVNELNYTVLRPCNSFGRKNETTFIVEYLVTSMLRREDVYIGTPASVRDFMYVDDHVDAYLKVIDDDRASHETFNVGSGSGISIRSLAEKVAKLMDYQGKVVEDYPPTYPTRPAFADPPYLVVDPSKIQTAIGWKVKYNLEEGLLKTAEYWREYQAHR
jgi:nucleoside-diphosphate-sugar epimerase